MDKVGRRKKPWGEGVQNSAEREFPRYSFTCFAVLSGLSGFLGYFFVYRQATLIQSKVGFFAMAVSLVFAAFVFSAVEAAFSVANRVTSLSEAINPKLSSVAEEYSSLAAKATAGIDALTRTERKRRNALERRSENLAFIRRVLNSQRGRRMDIVGALSALSVLLNTALAAFLPLFLVHGTPVGTLDLGVTSLDRQKIMIFVATALPIIYFGKIVPKTVGSQYPVFFAYKLFFVGNWAFWIIGWMPRGLHWALLRMRLLR